MIEQISQTMGPVAAVISRVLLHSLWQGSLIALLLAAALVLLRRRSAHLRYAVSGAAILVIVGLSAGTGVYITAEKPTASPAAVTQTDASPSVGSTEATASEVLAGTLATLEEEQAAEGWTLRSLQKLVFPSWVAGVLLLSLYHLIGWRRVKGFTRRSTKPVSEVWQERFSRLCATARLERAVEILGSSIAKAPCVVGWIKPVILIPLSSFSGLDAEELEMIILHELAHIRRHDVLVGYLQAIAEILFFFNPAVWWISRRIRLEREHCCDDLAITLSGDRLRYARALTSLAQSGIPRTRLVAAADGSPLLERVRRIMGMPPQEGHPSKGSIGGLLLLTALLTFGFSAFGGSTYSDTGTETALEQSEEIEPERGDIFGEWEVEYQARRHYIRIRFGGKRATGFSFDADDLARDTDLSGTSFKLVRDAGTFYLQGDLERDGDELRGRGDCFFRANQEYIKAMEDLGYDLRSKRRDRYSEARSKYERRLIGIGDDHVLALAVHNVSLDFARGLNDLGYDDLSFSKLVEARIHGVTPEFIRELDDLGYRGLRMSRLVEMRIHGARPEYIKEMSAAGYDNLPEGKLVEFRIHGVDPEFVKEMADLGFDDLSGSKLVEFRIHGVNAEFVRELAELGYDNLSGSKLVEFRIHGVSAEFVRELAELGYYNLSGSKLVEFRIHGVSPDFIREMAELGYDDLSPSRLVEFRIHGVTSRYIRRLAELGYENVRPSRLVEMRIHDVSPSYIRKLQSRGYDDLSTRELVEFRIHGR